MKRLFTLLLAVLMLLPLFAACKKDKTGEATVVKDSTICISYDKSMLTIKEAQAYQSQIKADLGLNVTLLQKVTEETTVIFGDLDCDACRAANTDLRSKDYVLGVFEGMYVVGARNATMLKKAIDEFLADILPQTAKGKLVMTADANKLVEGTYQINNLTIAGHSLGRSAIVIPKDYSVSEYRTAAILRYHLTSKAGYSPEIVYDAAPEGVLVELRIGKAVCKKAQATGDNGFYITGNGSALEVVANSQFGYEVAQVWLQNTIFIKRNDTLDITDEKYWEGTGDSRVTEDPAKEAGAIRIMENNIYGGSAFYNGEGYDTEQRVKMAMETYAVYQPDVLGVQEFHDNIRAEFMDPIRALGYEEVPIKSTSSRAVNSTPLFYRTDRLEWLDKGYYWYTNINYADPAYASIIGTYAPNSVRERTAADYSKGVTWAIFREKATGNVFMVGSTHLWWQGEVPEDDVCRQVQVAFVKELLLTEANKWLAANDPEAAMGSMPIFFGGDMNTAPSRTSFGLVDDATPLTSNLYEQFDAEATKDWNTCFSDCFNTAVGEKSDVGSHHAYAHWNDEMGIYDNPSYNERKHAASLDYIFGARSAAPNYRVLRWACVADLYSYLVSDHCPVFTDVLLYPNK